MRRKTGNGGVITKILQSKLSKVHGKPHHDQIVQSMKKLHRDENAHELLELVRSRIEVRKGYIRLGALGTFLVVYVATILSQQNVADSFSVESR